MKENQIPRNSQESAAVALCTSDQAQILGSKYLYIEDYDCKIWAWSDVQGLLRAFYISSNPKFFRFTWFTQILENIGFEEM